ncbi:hypothetical protein EE612_053062 [Oryza sativa]|nr:hypothetical protein EE612_053062 [Oryza sativa]
MRYTHVPIPKYADCNYGLQIFSVKVNQLLLNEEEEEEEEEGLHWPLHVYGLVATRDSLDPRRNLLFNRTRDNCQILTQQDPFLLLTGPTRAVVLVIDPVKFEIQLKAKGTSESEDKVLNFRVLVYHHDYSLADPPFIVRRRRRCKRSELEFAFTLLVRSVEATISVQVVDGSSWPDDLGVQVAARTASIKIVLLDSQKQQDGKMPIDDDGFIQLSRRVVSVELAGQLIVQVLAFNSQQQVVDNDNDNKKDEIVAKHEIVFDPKEASLSVETCELQLGGGGGGPCKLQISVAWSLVDRLPPVGYF